ncbi:MAG: BON domain-containing protein [Pyrinomonadaceae bacterium]
MPNRIPPRRLTLAFMLACVCIFSALAVATARTPQRRRAARARPAAVDCSTMTDADIVTAIQAKIKADNRYTGQWAHINVSSRERVVRLEGWIVGKGAIPRLVSYAKRTKCVARVENRLHPHKSVGCGPNEKPCGDGCVERASDCNAISNL